MKIDLFLVKGKPYEVSHENVCFLIRYKNKVYLINATDVTYTLLFVIKLNILTCKLKLCHIKLNLNIDLRSKKDKKRNT
jgi:hypothetical protein